MKVVAVDQGTTGTKSYVYDDAGRFTSGAGLRACANLSAAGLGRARSGGTAAPRDGGHRRGRQGRCHRHRQPGRNGHRLGCGHRPAHPQRHRLAGRPHQGRDRAAEGRGRGGADAERSPACRSIPISPPPSCAGSSTMFRRRRQLLREKRLRLGTSEAFFLARLTGALRHRRHHRLAHQPDVARQLPVGSASSAISSACRSNACRRSGPRPGLSASTGACPSPRASSTSRPRSSAMAAPMSAT